MRITGFFCSVAMGLYISYKIAIKISSVGYRKYLLKKGC